MATTYTQQYIQENKLNFLEDSVDCLPEPLDVWEINTDNFKSVDEEKELADDFYGML